MPTVAVFRKEHFNAAHRLHSDAFDEATNEKIFGKCNNPHFHGHNYDLIVKITGEPDKQTGYVIDLKALSDIICTSSNAEKIIESLPKEQKIIFAPDKNLGAYLNKKTGRDMVLWNGACMVHEIFSLEKIYNAYSSCF